MWEQLRHWEIWFLHMYILSIDIREEPVPATFRSCGSPSFRQGKGPAALDLVVTARVPPGPIAGLTRRIRVREQIAVSAQRGAVLLQHVGVEEVALERVVEVAQPARVLAAGLRVLGVLRAGVCGAHGRVEGAGEELRAEEGRGVAVRPAAAVLRVRPPRGCGRGGRVGFFVAVGAGDDDLEVVAVLAEVGCRGGIDAGAPERAAVVGDGGGVGAVGGWVDGRVALDVEVETGAEGGVVAVLRTAEGVVGSQEVVAQVGVGGDGGVEVMEGLNVAFGGDSGQCFRVEWWVGFKCSDCVWGDLWAVAAWLGGAGGQCLSIVWGNGGTRGRCRCHRG